jgi:iron complex outermembrane receptor protein
VRYNPATIAGLKSNGTRDARTEITSANVKATGSVYELSAGEINVATGVEWRDERFRDKRSQDQLLNQSTPVGQSKGTRRVQAAYAEVRVPLTAPAQQIPALHSLDLNVAGRYESYSDAGFSETAVPKVGLRWQPLNEQVTFRASAGEGYRAPSLAELYQPQTTSIVFNLADPLRAGRTGSNANDTNTGQRQLVSGGNPNLKPETSTSYNYGVYVEPKFIPGLSLSADFFKIEMEDRIGPPASAAIILANPALFPGFVDRAPQTASDIANNLPGELVRIRTVLGNFGTARTEGLDLAAEYRLSTERYGRFTTRVAASKVFDTVIRSRPDLPAVDVVGTYEVPDFRGSGSLGWSYGNLGVSFTADYIGDFTDTAPSTKQVPKQIITGTQVSYAFPWDTKVTLGVNNLFDKAPPLTAGSTGYAERTSYFLPRFVYLDVTKKF